MSPHDIAKLVLLGLALLVVRVYANSLLKPR